MSIVRAPRPSRHYTVLRDDLLRDKNLSFRALGVLVEILSRPDNWQTRAETLAAGRKEGRDAVRTALAELRAAGYLVQQKVRGPDGRIATISFIYDTPQEQPATGDGSTGAGFPGVGKPGAGLPAAGFPGPLRKTDKEYREEVPIPTNRQSSDAAAASSSNRSAVDDDVRPKIQKPRQRRGRTDRERDRAVELLATVGYGPLDDEVPIFLAWLRREKYVKHVGAYIQGILDEDGEDKLSDLVIEAYSDYVAGEAHAA